MGAEKAGRKALLYLDNEDDGGGKPLAKEAALQLSHEEQATNADLADI